MRKIQQNILIFISLCLSSSFFAQESVDRQISEKLQTEQGEGVLKAKENFKPEENLGFLFIGGYAFGIDDKTSGKGTYIPVNEKLASSNFYLKYARIKGTFKISPKVQANLLLNLADFKNKEISKKILEIASVTYKHSKELNMRIGQFRPYFGIENTYGVTKHKSYGWGENYKLLGKSNWQSFQIGASVYGDLSEQNVPLKYYLNVYNGNGKNSEIDNDSNKTFSSRLTLTAIPNVEIGANYATTNYKGENVKAIAFDFLTKHKLINKLKLNTEFSYAYGNNLRDVTKAKVTGKNIDNYKFVGWFFTPQLIYDVNSKDIKSLEFSCRYESIYDNLEINKNLFTGISPMISLNLSNNLKTSLVGVFNRYDKNNIAEEKVDTSYMMIQLKFDY